MYRRPSCRPPSSRSSSPIPVASPGICRIVAGGLLEAVELLVDRGLQEALPGLYAVAAEGEDRSFGLLDHRFAAVFAREHRCWSS
jgi:hypothetical protein